MSSGHVYPFGHAQNLGDLSHLRLGAPIVDAVGDGTGYVLVGADGGVFAFGSVRFRGSLAGRHLPAPIVGIDVTPNNLGYWAVDRQGHVYGFGDAKPLPNTAHLIARPSPSAHVVGIAANGTRGYYLAWSDGTVIGYGTAHFGAKPRPNLSAPIVRITRAGGLSGIYLLGADGSIFALGGADFLGSMSGRPLAQPATAMYFFAAPRTSPPGSASCAFRARFLRTFATQAQFEAAVTGVWFSCQPISIFATDDLGLQINPDHTWDKIFGTLDSPELGTGPGSRGTWKVLDISDANSPGTYQLELIVGSDASIGVVPRLSNDDQHMHLDNNGTWVDDYVRWEP
jgi:hypothetical protein